MNKMWKNAEKMDLSCRNQLLWVPTGSHGFWAHNLLPNLSHDPDVDPRRVTILLTFTTHGVTDIWTDHDTVLAGALRVMWLVFTADNSSLCSSGNVIYWAPKFVARPHVWEVPPSTDVPVDLDWSWSSSSTGCCTYRYVILSHRHVVASSLCLLGLIGADDSFWI